MKHHREADVHVHVHVHVHANPVKEQRVDGSLCIYS